MVEIRQIDRSDRSTVGQMHREGCFTFAEGSKKVCVLPSGWLGPSLDQRDGDVQPKLQAEDERQGSRRAVPRVRRRFKRQSNL